MAWTPIEKHSAHDVTALGQRLGVNLQRPKQILQGPRRCRSSCTTWQLHFRGTVGRCGKGAHQSQRQHCWHTRARQYLRPSPAEMAHGLPLQVFVSAPPMAEDMSRFGEAAEAAPERFSVLCNELSGSSVLSILICLSLAQHSAVRSHCTARGARAASGVT